MTTEQIQVREWMKIGQQECPLTPTSISPTVAKLRIELIYEELTELAEALGFYFQEDELYDICVFYRPKTNQILVADALADLLIVVLGTAVACGIDLDPCFQEVMRSNNTKFVKDGNGNFTVVKNRLGKIMKPATYKPPNLQPILDHQIANPLS